MINRDTVLPRLTRILTQSVSPYHCIQEAERQLLEAGFTALPLTGSWELAAGGAYMINVFDSTLAAFTLPAGFPSADGSEQKPADSSSAPQSSAPALRLAAAHTDWPCLKVKPSPEVSTSRYGKLNVEVYGGPILSTWLDRPLSLAGKVTVMTADPLHPEVRFLNCARPVLTIPNLAIHMNREVNKGVELNPQVDMLPLAEIITDELEKDCFFLNFLAEELQVKKEDILDYELCIYNTEAPAVTGFHNEFLSAPRLDNVTSVQACLTGLISSMEHADSAPDPTSVAAQASTNRDAAKSTTGSDKPLIRGIVLYDNEEIGSHTKQGADSMLLERLLEKLYLSLGFGRAAFLDALMSGFLLSLDVAHAMHPNHSEKCDIKNQIIMGDGVALKLASSQAYATDASYAAVVEGLCRKGEIPYRKFSNRSDIRGGSTLGSISSARLNMPTVDAGVPMLAMHSARELIHIDDQVALEKMTAAFFSA